MLRVKAIPGESTRFWVESNTLICSNAQCSKLYTRRERHRLVPGQAYPTEYLHIGDSCPKCGQMLDVRFHTVDIAANHYAGQCSCEFWSCVIGPKLSRMLPSEQTAAAKKLMDSHIAAARDFALDVALHAHEHERYAKAGKQREEDQP